MAFTKNGIGSKALKAVSMHSNCARRAAVYRAEELQTAPPRKPTVRASLSVISPAAGAISFILPNPLTGLMVALPRKDALLGTSHVSPYNLRSARPRPADGLRHPTRPILPAHHAADIAPTFAALCGITLAPRRPRPRRSPEKTSIHIASGKVPYRNASPLNCMSFDRLISSDTFHDCSVAISKLFSGRIREYK